jgi:hypothetical protein
LTPSSAAFIAFFAKVVVDPQAAAVDLLSLNAEPEQLVLHQGEHVAALAAEDWLERDLRELRQPRRRLVGLVAGDLAHLHHAVEHVLVARLEQRPCLLAVGRVEGRRVVEHRGQHGALPQVSSLASLPK